MFFQHLGRTRNIASVLGNNPLWWCWPTAPLGNGLKYEMSNADGEWFAMGNREGRDVHDVERNGDVSVEE